MAITVKLFQIINQLRTARAVHVSFLCSRSRQTFALLFISSCDDFTTEIQVRVTYSDLETTY